MPDSAQGRWRVLVLGGGFAGYYAARKLGKLRKAGVPLEVTLVSGENFLLFTPMLHEVAASDVDPSNIVVPLRKYLPGVNVAIAQVQAIELKKKEVTVVHGPQAHRHSLSYDYLLIALGSVTNFHNLPGVEENSITMKSLEDAFYLRNHMIRELERAELDAGQGIASKTLTFTVCGGGFAGVETVGAMMDFLQDATAFYPHLRRDMIRVVLVHSGPQLLPELGGRLGVYAHKKLCQRGVGVRLDAAVHGFRDGAVLVSENGAETAIRTNTVVWTAGVMPAAVVEGLPCASEKGRLVTKPTMELAERSGVYAVGDCAAIPRPGCPSEYYGPTAQNAMRQGELAASNILAAIRGRPQRPFAYRELGQLAAIGNRRGVAKVLGVQFSGILAWWFWRTVYLYKLPGFQKKLRVALDWTLDIVFSKDIIQFRTPRIPAMDRPVTAPAAEGGDVTRRVA